MIIFSSEQRQVKRRSAEARRDRAGASSGSRRAKTITILHVGKSHYGGLSGS
jgi:hypothetical protein